MSESETTYPRVLNGNGCIYGRGVKEDVDSVKLEVNGLSNKLDKILWALVAAAVSLSTASVLLWINLVK